MLPHSLLFFFPSLPSPFNQIILISTHEPFFCLSSMFSSSPLLLRRGSESSGDGAQLPNKVKPPQLPPLTDFFSHFFFTTRFVVVVHMFCIMAIANSLDCQETPKAPDDLK